MVEWMLILVFVAFEYEHGAAFSDFLLFGRGKVHVHIFDVTGEHLSPGCFVCGFLFAPCAGSCARIMIQIRRPSEN